MQILGSQLIGTPVMSLHTGARVASLETPVIDPGTLTILAYSVQGPLLTEHPSFLRMADVREFGHLGMIIDDADEIVGLDDVLKIKEMYELQFQLVGMSVIDEHKHKLGKIADYTVEAGSFTVQKLQVRRGFFKSLNDTGLLIHRSQIVEITRERIVVKATAKPVVTEERETPVAYDYVNPFRKPSAQPES